MKYMFLGLMLFTLSLGCAVEGSAQTSGGPVSFGVLQSRYGNNEAGIDNYAYATFSFIAGANGPEAQKRVRNDWDIQFAARYIGGKKVDAFHVTMVTDDRSRIVDLGSLDWSDSIVLPDLPAFEEPTREKDVEAKVGHIYYVHTADRNSDHYALFRVEELKTGESVAISWKLVGEPKETSR